MIEGEDGAEVIPIAAAPSGERLPYTIEVWNLARSAPERVIGRAASAPLARAIFVAAQSEHPGRRVRLRRGSQVLAESD